jgi:hypothetical protein
MYRLHALKKSNPVLSDEQQLPLDYAMPGGQSIRVYVSANDASGNTLLKKKKWTRGSPAACLDHEPIQ